MARSEREALMSIANDICSNEELTIVSRFIRNNRLEHFIFNPLDEITAFLQIPCSPELLRYTSSAQRLRSRLLESVLFLPQLSLQLRCMSQVVCMVERV